MGIEKRISQRIAKALMTFQMISSGDRILVGASGGKDSTSLVYHLALKRRTFPTPFELAALHIHTEYCTCNEHPEIWDLVRSWDVELHRVKFSIADRLKSGKRMNCYWCATQRRTELMNFSRAHGYDKIALGHHQDDILETFFMNMVYKGELSTMLPVMDYDRYPQTIIRPLALVKEQQLVEFAGELGIARISCSCTHDSRSTRRTVRRHIESLCSRNPGLKDNMFRAAANPNLRYLMVGDNAPKNGL